MAPRVQVWRVAVVDGEGASLEEQCSNLSGISLVLLLV